MNYISLAHSCLLHVQQASMFKIIAAVIFGLVLAAFGLFILYASIQEGRDFDKWQKELTKKKFKI